ncbi:beta-1,4-galactosyltransferase [Candidatus Micrarchaeota archaeon]|nr:beta-1,4-galactosyltransferase [Candidatus Micrarchaeota archaeon]
MKKIFVTIGTAIPFDRLIHKLNQINKNNIFDITAQIGKSNFQFININKIIDYLTPNELKKEIKRCDIVISHAGAGTIIDLIKLNKKCVLVPRLKEFEEAVDNHQVEICKELEKEGACICYDISKLEELLPKATKVLKNKSKEYKKFKKNINDYIKSIE